MSVRVGWPQRPLGEVVEYLGSGISRPFYNDNVGIPVLRSNNVKNGRIVLEDLKFWHVCDPRGANLETVKPRPKDMLVNFVNGSSKELGKAAIFEGEPKGCIASTNFFIVRFQKDIVDPEFANLYFQSKYYARWLYKVAGFSGQGSFNQEEFRKLMLPIPPMETQRKIVRDSEVWSRAIDLTDRLIAAKHECSKWLMQQLLTGKRRLPGFSKPWNEIKMSALFKPIRRKNDQGITRVLTASGEHGLVDQTDFFKRSVAGESLDGYFLLRRGEYAYNRSSMNGYPYGAIKRLDEYEEGVLSTLYICFALRSTDLCSDYYKHLFESGMLNSQLREVVQVGARAHGLLNITLQNFFSVKIPCPPNKEQRKIATVCNAVYRELDLLRKQNKLLQEQKKGLMQELLTGKRKVKMALDGNQFSCLKQ